VKHAIIVSTLLYLTACAGGTVEGERIGVDNDVADVCGEAPGLAECRDVDGETFEQELDVNTTPNLGSDKQMEKQVDHLKHESFEHEVEDLEGS
jgi:hypothetical protein